jgi:hypothetical protein
MSLDRYQQRARECLQMAGRAAVEEDRSTWRDLARCWLRLSAHAAQSQQSERDPGPDGVTTQ